MSGKSRVRLEIHLKGGGSFAVDVVDWKFVKNAGVRSLEWETPVDFKGRRRLAHVSMDEVVALVEVTR